MSWPLNSPDSFNGGFWTTKQGSMDWCEENYTHSPYIAETTNTLSNLPYIILGLYGMKHCRQQRLPTRFVLCHLSLLCVGLGSAAYHATLRNWAQPIDELFMFYTVSFITYTVFDTVSASKRQSFVAPVFTLALAFLWTAAYTQIQTPVFHEIGFALLSIATVIRVLLLFNSLSRLCDPTFSRKIRFLYYQGFGMFMSGFLVWNLDNWFCIPLRAWRNETGWPATWFAQGHAFWHIATAVGAYRMIVASEILFLVITQRGNKYAVEGSIFPVVRTVLIKRN